MTMTATASTWARLDHPPAGELGTNRHDWHLVDAAQAGDDDAFSAIYRTHFAEVFALLKVKTRDSYLAEELANETFLRAFRKIDTLNYRGRSVAAWLTTIAKNLVRDDVKSARRRHEVSSTALHERAREDLDPEQIVCSQLIVGQVARSMRVLTAAQRLCLTLRFFEGMSVAETAQRMGRNPGAVRAIQTRAVRSLAIELLPQLREECA